MDSVVFYLFAAIVLGSALMVVTMNNLVRGVFLFFVSLFGLAGLYVFALADFIAVTQVVIYAGGVLVLMLFAFMLSNRELLSGLQRSDQGFRVRHLSGIAISLGFLFIITMAVLAADIDQLGWIRSSEWIEASDNTVEAIGVHTMTKYLLPFEVISVFLMMALIGAAHLARKEKLRP